MASSSIKTFSNTGDAVATFGGYGSGQPGFRQANGQVYRRPRLELTDQIGPGAGVRTTNMKAHPRIQARRERGIGMGSNNSAFQSIHY